MSLNSEITRIENDKQAIKEAITNKGGTIISPSLDSCPEEINNLPTGGTTDTDPDWEKNPDAYLAIKRLTSPQLQYVNDQNEAETMLMGNNSRSENHLITEFYISPKAEELTNVTSSYGFLAEAYYLTKVDGLRYLTSLQQVDSFLACQPSGSEWPTYGSLKSIDQLPPNLSYIGNDFFYGQYRFNQELVIPETVWNIGGSFMYNCVSYAQPLTIPANVNSIQWSFMRNCDNFTGPLTANTFTTPNDGLIVELGDAVAFTSGVAITGPYAKEWLEALPYLADGWQYRNTYDADVQPGDYGSILYTDANNTQHEAEIPDGKVWGALNGKGAWPIVIDGTQVEQNQVTGYRFGVRTANVIPDNFLAGAPYIYDLGTLPSTLVSIGNNFLVNNQKFNSPLVIPATVTLIGDNFLSGSNFNSTLSFAEGSELSTLGSGFLFNCVQFDQPVVLPASVQILGSSFLSGCTSFNQPFTFPANINQIGSEFLSGCTSFNQPLVVPSTVTSIGSGFLYGCNNMLATITADVSANVLDADSRTLSASDSTAPVFQIGWDLQGTYAQEWMDRLPVSVFYNYRWFQNSDITPGDWGTLTYNDSEGSSQTRAFRSQEEFNALSNQWGYSDAILSPLDIQANQITAFVPGKLCTTYPLYFLRGCSNLTTFGELVPGTLDLGYYFLAGCTSLNSPITVPSSLLDSGLGQNFLAQCTSLNSSVTITNENLTYLPQNFMSDCTAMKATVQIDCPNITELRSGVFKNCPNIKEIYFNVSSGISLSGDTSNIGVTNTYMFSPSWNEAYSFEEIKSYTDMSGTTITGPSAATILNLLPPYVYANGENSYMRFWFKEGQYAWLQTTYNGTSTPRYLTETADLIALLNGTYQVPELEEITNLGNAQFAVIFGPDAGLVAGVDSIDNFLHKYAALSKVAVANLGALTQVNTIGDWFLSGSAEYDPTSLNNGHRLSFSVLIPSNIKKIGHHFLDNCRAGDVEAPSLVFSPESVEEIGDFFMAKSYMELVKSMHYVVEDSTTYHSFLPPSVTKIGCGLFAWMQGYNSEQLHLQTPNLTSIGNGFCYQANNLSALYFDGNTAIPAPAADGPMVEPLGNNETRTIGGVSLASSNSSSQLAQGMWLYSVGANNTPTIWKEALPNGDITVEGITGTWVRNLM